jgi:transposase
MLQVSPWQPISLAFRDSKHRKIHGPGAAPEDERVALDWGLVAFRKSFSEEKWAVKCTEAVMESTGTYWKPVFNILEGSLKIILANPEQVKALCGKKTDPKDSRWLASLLRHGLVQGSFIPPRDIRELRDLTRRHMRTIEEMIEELDQEIARRLKPYQQQIQLACTVRGIKPTSAASILAETGMDISPEGPFPDCHHLASWATVCPGNNESGGKRKNGRTRQGNRWLRATLTQTGWAGAADKNLFSDSDSDE